MPQPPISEKILSEEYADIILALELNLKDFLERYSDLGAQNLGGGFGLIHVPISELPPNPLTVLGYSNIPKLYTPLQDINLEESGILSVQSQPLLGYRGKDIILGFLDTGIRYQDAVFRKPDGSTRLVGLWDQGDPKGTPPMDMNYGSGYSREEINAALFSENPLLLVPSQDEDGHGTAVASAACGTPIPEEDFLSPAPECDIAVVKLKPAKKYLRDFFLIPDGPAAYQDSDIMTGLLYLIKLANSLEKPLVICLALGSNQGDHAGNSPLCEILDLYNTANGFYTVIAGGNEAGQSHHYFGKIPAERGTQDVELLVGENDSGFSLELWAKPPELYSISVISPLGEDIPAVPARLGQNATLNFVLERTVIEVHYEIVEAKSGSELILLRFRSPTAGIWTLRIENQIFVNGQFHMWLPITSFVNPGTIFLTPDPYTTLTEPSTAASPVTVSTYNAYNGSLYIHSSRGFTRTGGIKPELCAPGVEVRAAAISGKISLFTGSSMASALTAGAMALLVNWGLDRPLPHLLTSTEMKTFLIRGARRSAALDYPNQSWGYGTLDLYGIFESFL